MNHETHLIRHYIASLAYHITKVIKSVPETYPDFELGRGTRTPKQILVHINAVLVYSYKCFDPPDYAEIQHHRDSAITWHENVDFLYYIFKRLDEYFLSDHPILHSVEQILQGPLSDVMTHIGQLSMLRRIAGSSVPAEDFIVADIQVGVVGPDQPAPVSVVSD